MLGAFRRAKGLVGLVGRWEGPEGPDVAIVGHDPIRMVTTPDGLLSAFDDLPEVGDVDGEVAVGSAWLGVLGYQLGRAVEPMAPPAAEPMGGWGRLGYYASVLRYEAEADRWWFEAVVEPGSEDEVRARLDHDAAVVASASSARAEPYRLGAFGLEPSEADHRAAVEAVKAAIVAGDVFQVNACLHALARFDGDPVDLFLAGLERLRPRYGAYVSMPGGGVCSFSPELFLRVAGRSVLTSPIKGTARRAEDRAAADAARAALVASAKDGAENAMIVDLMRNDLGRVCRAGSVEVAELARTEAHPGVWHLVSDVVGELAPEAGYEALLRSTFPAGSITGAPKVRAMEIVNELEPVGRGAYTGSIGFASPLRGLTLNVAIRTFEVAGGIARLGVGGGIVADSDVDGEVEECFTKARPLVEAVGGRLVRAGPTPGTTAATLPPPLAPRTVLSPRPAWGVFETMRVERRRVAFLDAHLARLAASVGEVLARALPDGLRRQVVDLASTLSGAGRLKVVVRPAGGDVRLELSLEAITPSRGTPGAPPPAAAGAASAGAGSDEAASERGVGLAPVTLPGGLGAHKWVDRRLLGALRPAGLAPGDQLLLVDADGLVLEAERASVFAVLDGVLRTPGLDQPILPGVARAWVIEEAARTGFPLAEGPLCLDELVQAEEVLVTNALRGVVKVSRVGGVPLGGSAPVTAALGRAMGRAFRFPAASAGLAPGPPGGGAPGRPAAAARGRWAPPRGAGPGRRRPVVVVDNFDSFTYNLTQALEALGAPCTVVRSTEVTADEVAALDPRGLVVSPGPCTPAEAGISVEVIRRLSRTVPTLGVCLGHQCIAVAYGARVVQAPQPVHGRTSMVDHDRSALFSGLPARLEVARYHSLVVDEASLPEGLVVSARTGPIVMGIRHVADPVVGVQFHPESFLTTHGPRILANFLAEVAQRQASTEMEADVPSRNIARRAEPMKT